MGWTAAYVQDDEAPTEPLDILGLPEELRDFDVDHEACLRWADPDCPTRIPIPTNARIRLRT